MNNLQQPRLAPFDGWEAEAVNTLDGGGYDAELGLWIARDAIQVSSSELSDEALHGKYHEVVVTEFGRGARPIEPEGFDE